MSLFLLDDTLSVDVFYEQTDDNFNDNVCIRLWESCPEDEKILIADETNIFLTPDQALTLAKMLVAAVNSSQSQIP